MSIILYKQAFFKRESPGLRWIAGFAQAHTLIPAALARVLQGGEE